MCVSITKVNAIPLCITTRQYLYIGRRNVHEVVINADIMFIIQSGDCVFSHNTTIKNSKSALILYTHMPYQVCIMEELYPLSALGLIHVVA